MCIYNIFLHHAAGHLGSFQFGETINHQSAAMDILVHVFGDHIPAFLLDTYLGMELLGH